MKLLLSAILTFTSSILYTSEKVTCQNMGQLANQMFQVAAATAYALDHGLEARFPDLKNAINGDLNIKHVFYRVNTDDFPPNTPFELYTEIAQNQYDPIPYKPGQNICIFGYFPHEYYICKHSDYIKELFAPSADILNYIHTKYGDLLQNPTVAVHVRTFFPDGIDPNNGIGRTNWNYFINAMALFPSDYTFLVFSDCPEWAKSHFPKVRENIHFIEGNPHYIDLYFISLCNHQILGPKSTFSWWGAWLNSNPNKIVIRPDDQWLRDDAFPPSWVKVSIEAQ